MNLGSPFILVIKDHPLYKQALENLMRLSFPSAVVASGSSVDEAFEFLAGQPPATVQASVLLLDLFLPGLSWLELIDRVHSAYPDLQIVAISGSDDSMTVGACLGSGVSAFVSKSTPPDQILDLIGRALRARLSDQTWLTANGPGCQDDLKRLNLTPRQIQVLRLICRGMSNRQIADELEIIEATAKAHVSAVFKELGVVSRTQALIAAQRMGFLGTA
jgi:DNA-binding NarL/FixJ family response regulator